MHNRGLCVGNPVTSGQTERGSTVHKEAETKLMPDRVWKRRVGQKFMESFDRRHLSDWRKILVGMTKEPVFLAKSLNLHPYSEYIDVPFIFLMAAS